MSHPRDSTRESTNSNLTPVNSDLWQQENGYLVIGSGPASFSHQVYMPTTPQFIPGILTILDETESHRPVNRFLFSPATFTEVNHGSAQANSSNENFVRGSVTPNFLPRPVGQEGLRNELHPSNSQVNHAAGSAQANFSNDNFVRGSMTQNFLRTPDGVGQQGLRYEMHPSASQVNHPAGSAQANFSTQDFEPGSTTQNFLTRTDRVGKQSHRYELHPFTSQVNHSAGSAQANFSNENFVRGSMTQNFLRTPDGVGQQGLRSELRPSTSQVNHAAGSAQANFSNENFVRGSMTQNFLRTPDGVGQQGLRSELRPSTSQVYHAAGSAQANFSNENFVRGSMTQNFLRTPDGVGQQGLRSELRPSTSQVNHAAGSAQANFSNENFVRGSMTQNFLRTPDGVGQQGLRSELRPSTSQVNHAAGSAQANSSNEQLQPDRPQLLAIEWPYKFQMTETKDVSKASGDFCPKRPVTRSMATERSPKVQQTQDGSSASSDESAPTSMLDREEAALKGLPSKQNPDNKDVAKLAEFLNDDAGPSQSKSQKRSYKRKFKEIPQCDDSEAEDDPQPVHSSESESEDDLQPQKRRAKTNTVAYNFSKVTEDKEKVIVISDDSSDDLSDDSLDDKKDVTWTNNETFSDQATSEDEEISDIECAIGLEDLNPTDELLRCHPCMCCNACLGHAVIWVAEHGRCYHCNTEVTGYDLVMCGHRYYRP